jgi:hypothetical protein
MQNPKIKNKNKKKGDNITWRRFRLRMSLWRWKRVMNSSVFWDKTPMQSFESKPTLRRNTSPTSSLSENKPSKTGKLSFFQLQRWTLAWLIPRSWRTKRYIPLKRWFNLKEIHGNVTREIWLFIRTAIRGWRTPWPESASELYWPIGSSLSAKLVPIFAGAGATWLLFLSSSSSIALTRLSGPRSRPTTSQKIW